MKLSRFGSGYEWIETGHIKLIPSFGTTAVMRAVAEHHGWKMVWFYGWILFYRFNRR